MLNAIRAEWLKLWRRPVFWIVLGVIGGLVVLSLSLGAVSSVFLAQLSASQNPQQRAALEA